MAAMDNRGSSFIDRFFSGGGSTLMSDSTNKVPLSPSGGLSQLSPYLSFDPSYLQQPEFITLEGASQRRGRFELAFSHIGGACLIGAGSGGAYGLYKGLQEAKNSGHVGTIKRTQLLNYAMKHGSATANTLGVITVMYSGLGCLLYYCRGSQEDEFNTVGAATLTGLLFRCTAGLKDCIKGTGAGLGVGLAMAICWAMFEKESLKDRLARGGSYM